MTSTTTEAPVPDMLDLDDLYELHRRLCKQAADLHATLMSGQVTRVSPLSDEWALISIQLSEIMKIATAAYVEITRRELDEYLLTSVPMVCTVCRAPIRPQPGQWVHESTDDYLACTVPDGTPVKAMVAAGNENVPLKLDGCTCAAISGSHKPPCPWSAGR